MAEARRVLGMILPSNNQVLIPELQDLERSGVTMACRRIPVSTATSEDVKKMAAHTREAITDLVEAGAEAIIYACMWTSLVVDDDWDQDMADFAYRMGGVSIDTASAALFREVDSCGARSIAVLTAYPRSVHAQMCELFANRGYDVAAVGTLDLSDFQSLTDVGTHDLLSLAGGVPTGSVEALCVLGTDLPTKDAVPHLEALSKVPVITSNGAIAAAAKRLLV